jgi:hypothetical protein
VLVVYIGDDGMGWTLNAIGLQPKLPFLPTSHSTRKARLVVTKVSLDGRRNLGADP